MDVFDILLQAGLITTAIVAYLLVFRSEKRKNGQYNAPGWNYPLKWLYARYIVSRWKKKLQRLEIDEWPLEIPVDVGADVGWDALTVRGTAPDGSSLFLSVRMLIARQLLAEIQVLVKLPDGTVYALPQSTIGPWESFEHGWSAHGLKFQVLDPERRMRITFNGVLTANDNTTYHARLNLIWAAASSAVRHPDDWSNDLAAHALALEPWRDEWQTMLSQNNESSWLQYGSMQGRFEAYDEEGATDKSVYLQLRGLKERSWSSKGYKGLRRSVRLTVASEEGTVVHLRCLSYRNVLTQCISGYIRFPNYSVESITSTDLTMANFCETTAQTPKLYSINVSSKNRSAKILLRINADVVKFINGASTQHEVTFRTAVVDIDGFAGSGILELGYEMIGASEINVRPSVRVLKHLSRMEAGAVPYCLAFEDRRAACSDYVGGKGASLALLASVQTEEGYRVPPGFCLTINALNRHLELNPAIDAAITEIEAANENYVENEFKRKCDTASALFISSQLSGDVKEEILASVAELRRRAMEQNLGPELRFAVRSSAVGEDSEVLSAAGQNETVLGCTSDEDIARGVLKCWASMFAFTSTYYRRVNGAACRCGGGVVVQTLVAPRAAGVLFTRHPAHGDPRRLLITANFGLGESVVSGSVEPDTFIIKRNLDSTLTLKQAVLGSKTRRVAVSPEGVTEEDIPMDERGLACLSDKEVLDLARLGIRQEKLWAAPRDIEWAVHNNEIFLLQARPITSLERWTEEELLHELDAPIMADTEITSFGNCGEVLPLPLTPMSIDVMSKPLIRGMDRIVKKDINCFNSGIVITHNRVAMNLYNCILEKVPKELDVTIKMIDLSVHGHLVTDEEIHSTALHRRPPRWYHKLQQIKMIIMTLLYSKSKMKDSVKRANALSIDDNLKEPMDLCQAIADKEVDIRELTYNHSITTTASASSQSIAMSVLMEDKKDFTPELFNEIGTLLMSSGDVLSAEVPQLLSSVTRNLEASGKFDEFRALDPKEGMRWLKENLPEIHSEVTKFLNQHGHRAVMEFELITKPWVLAPEELMKLLQNIKPTALSKQTAKTDDEIVAALKTPQKDITRKILKWLLPLCRRTIRHREDTKAHLILAIHKIRLAFLRLGQELVKQWYISNVDLVFFFRLKELNDYIRTRDPALLRKASQRQQYYAGWCKQKFKEINRGWPAPLAPKAPAVSAGDVIIEAATVCGGEVVARACVIKDLSEIEQLQEGDILITHATDIGWSPYFPLISGIVTELGGLISHGAVIAREYGLPCIVGASDATDIFKTGDMVRLSGTKGTLERVVLEKKKC